MADNAFSSTIIFIRGIPGSGKSYIATHLLSEKTDRPITLLDPDTLDESSPEYKKLSSELSKEGLDKAIHPFRWLRFQAVTAAQRGDIIIWNQPFTNRGIFDRLIAYIEDKALEKGVRLHVLLVEVNVPKDIAYKRIQERKRSGGHGPSENTFNTRVNEYQSFSDGYETVHIDGTAPIDTSVRRILELL